MLNLRRHTTVILLFLVLTLLYTWPGITRFDTHAIGDRFDTFQNVWNIWWIKTALCDFHQNPYHTDYLFHPNGFNLVFQTLNPFNGLIALPLWPFFDLITIFNIVLVLSFVLSGYFMYLLAFHLTRHRPAAVLAGLIFTFCPYHTAHAMAHLQLVSMQFMPLYILFLIKSFETGRIRHRYLAALFLVLTALCSWYYLFFLLMLTLFYAVKRWLARDNSLTTIIKTIGPVLITAYLALSPIFAGMIHAYITHDFTGAHPPEGLSADLAGFFIPARVQTIGRFFTSVTDSFGTLHEEYGNYLGYTVILLAALGFWKTRLKNRLASFLAVSAGIFFILSLGWNLHFMGKSYNSITLPYQWLYDICFFFRFTGVPQRFTVMVIICLSLLAAFGLKWLAGRYRSRLMISAVMIILLVEYLTVPFILTRYPGSALYDRMAADSRDYAVIHIPNGPSALYYQTLHGKRLMGGYVTRPTLEVIDFLHDTPIVNNIFYLNLEMNGFDSLTEDSLRDISAAACRRYNIGYIIIESTYDKALFDSLGFTEVFADNNFRAWRHRDLTIDDIAIESQ